MMVVRNKSQGLVFRLFLIIFVTGTIIIAGGIIVLQLKFVMISPTTTTTKTMVTKTTKVDTIILTEQEDDNVVVERMSSSSSSSSFLQNGGVVLFFHVPKTGGSSIQTILKRMPNIDYYWDPNKAFKYTTAMDQWVVNGTKNRTKVLEVHGRNPSFLHLTKQITKWRQLCQQYNIPFFTFAMVRHPISWSISFYNWWWCDQAKECNGTLYGHTVDDFIQFQRSNPQCCHLHSDWTTVMAKQCNFLTTYHCNNVVFEEMIQNLDWVGTTEQFNRTLNGLISLGIIPSHNVLNSFIKGTTKFNVIPKTKQLIHKDMLNVTVLEYLQNKTQLDLELYNKIQEQYPNFVIG